MKKNTLLLLIIALTTLGVQAQTETSPFQKNGFLGITIGSAIPLGDFADDSFDNEDAGLAENGFNITLLTFGYEFVENFGIAASWFGGGHLIETDFGNGIWAYGALVVGPMATVELSEKVDLDFKLMVGPTSGILDGDGLDEQETGSGFGVDIGTSLRISASERFGVMFNMDYFNTKSEFDGFEQKMTALNLNVGVFFRI